MGAILADVPLKTVFDPKCFYLVAVRQLLLPAVCLVALRLLGVEGQSVAPAECTVAVHRQLLSSGMVLLEGLDLSGVEEGIYFLMAAPLKIDGADGSPVRAILLERQT